jgi:hypothetical protein
VADSYDASPVSYDFSLSTPQTVQDTLPGLGVELQGSLAVAGERHDYTFTATIGQRLYFDALALGSNLNVTLIGPSGHSVGSSYLYGGDFGPVTLAENGTYRLEVSGSGSATGSYDFRLLDVAAQPALSPNVTVSGSVSPGSAAVLYQIAATANEALSLNFDSTGTSSDLVWTLYGPDNQTVQFSYQGSQDITLPGDGIYLLALTGSTSSSSHYQLQDELVDAVFSGK